MPQQIDSHHGQCVHTAFQHVVGIVVLNTEILAEAQRFRLKPGLLQFYQDEVFRAVGLPDTGSEVDAENRHRVAFVVDILMGAHLHLYNVLFQQGRQDGAGDTLVLHQILEHNVIDWIGYGNHKLLSVLIAAKIHIISQ